jgi:predicted amino acid racemase
MVVVDLGNNQNDLKVGDLLEFRTDYMGALRLLNSRYIDKRVI